MRSADSGEGLRLAYRTSFHKINDAHHLLELLLEKQNHETSK